MKKIIILSLFLVSTYSFSADNCKVHIEAENLNSMQISRVTKLLRSLNYDVVSDSKKASYSLNIKKERYFNVHGYPHFFMREINLDFYHNGIKLYETFSSDGFPVYRALGDVLDDLEVNAEICSTP